MIRREQGDFPEEQREKGARYTKELFVEEVSQDGFPALYTERGK